MSATNMTARQARRKLGSRKSRKTARKVLKSQMPMFKVAAIAKAKAARAQVKR